MADVGHNFARPYAAREWCAPNPHLGMQFSLTCHAVLVPATHGSTLGEGHYDVIHRAKIPAAPRAQRARVFPRTSFINLVYSNVLQLRPRLMWPGCAGQEVPRGRVMRFAPFPNLLSSQFIDATAPWFDLYVHPRSVYAAKTAACVYWAPRGQSSGTGDGNCVGAD